MNLVAFLQRIKDDCWLKRFQSFGFFVLTIVNFLLCKIGFKKLIALTADSSSEFFKSNSASLNFIVYSTWFSRFARYFLRGRRGQTAQRHAAVACDLILERA